MTSIIDEKYKNEKQKNEDLELSNYYLKKGVNSLTKDATKAKAFCKKLYSSGHYQDRITINKKLSRNLSLKNKTDYIVILIPLEKSVVEQLQELEE